MVTAERLARIDVAFQGNPVRSYDLIYTEGAFHKSLLSSVTQRGANGTALGTHTFSYYDDIRDGSGQYDAFDPSVDWSTGDDNVTAGLLGQGKASALSGSLSTSIDGHLYLGFNPLAPLKQGSFGAKVGFTHSTSDGKLALIDLNGDDLPDKVFKTGGGISVRFNTSGPNGSTTFGPAVPVPTLPAISKGSSNTVNFGPEAYLTANVFANHAVTFSTASVYFSDVNGDGLPDALKFTDIVAGTAGSGLFVNRGFRTGGGGFAFQNDSNFGVEITWLRRISAEECEQYLPLSVPCDGDTLVASDPGLRVADFNGDGRQDILSFAAAFDGSRDNDGIHAVDSTYLARSVVLIPNAVGRGTPVATDLDPHPDVNGFAVKAYFPAVGSSGYPN